MLKENQHTHIRNERANRKVILKILRSRKSKRESEKEKRARQLTFNARHNTT